MGVPFSGCPGLAGESSTVSLAHTNLFGLNRPPGNREVKGVLVSDGLNDCGNSFRCCNSAAWQCTAETLSGSGHCWNTSILLIVEQNI